MALEEMPPPMALALTASFGSVERWREEHDRLRGEGEVLLCFVAQEGRLAHRTALGPGEALLWSSAHGPKLDWAAVYQRYQEAVHAASEGLGVVPQALGDALLLDVRRAGIYEQAQQQIPGARWCDPARVGQWSAELPAGRPVVVYCVYGHEVGRSTALRLRARGLDARYLEGGIEGWRAQGRPLAAKGGIS
jgi:Fe-Mn family superoxide dismutase